MDHKNWRAIRLSISVVKLIFMGIPNIDPRFLTWRSFQLLTTELDFAPVVIVFVVVVEIVFVFLVLLLLLLLLFVAIVVMEHVFSDEIY